MDDDTLQIGDKLQYRYSESQRLISYSFLSEYSPNGTCKLLLTGTLGTVT